MAEESKTKLLRSFIEDKYAPWVKAERKTGAAMVQSILYNFSDFLERPLEEINTWVIEKWRSERIKAGKAKSSVNRDVTGLKACLSKAVEWGVIEQHPLAGLKPIKIDTFDEIMHWEEVEVDRNMEVGTALNRIPGGFKGMKFLYEHRLTRSHEVTLKERDRAIQEYQKQHPRAGIPNLLNR